MTHLYRIHHFIIFSLILSGCSTLDSWVNPPSSAPQGFVRTENTPESEARAAFVNVVRVAQKKDVDAFKKLIAPQSLASFEQAEWEHPGQYASWMESIAAEKPKNYHLDLTPSMAVFMAEPTVKLGDYTKAKPTEVILIREGPQWMIGAPLKPMDDLPPERTRSKKTPTIPSKTNRKNKSSS